MQKSLVYLAAALVFTFSRCLAASGPGDLPRPTNYVSDFAHVLSPHAVEQINRACAQLDHSDANTQIAVVTISSLNGSDIAEYARDLGNLWGIGKKESNRGVVVLLAINDRKWRIEVGLGLERVLTNSKAEEIGEKMIPQLKANDFDEAIRIAVSQIAQTVSTEAARPAVRIPGE